LSIPKRLQLWIRICEPAGGGPLTTVIRILLYILASAFFLKISWRPLHNPRSHGFYRFFVFEGVLILFLLNAPYWFHDPLSLRQALSLVMLLGALYCVVRAVRLLKQKGGRRSSGATPENLAFENTAHLVTEGIFAHIRHPMYTSLLLLTWGLFLKRIHLLGFLLAMVTTACTVVAARFEERENLVYFGRRYREYMQRSKRFIPFIV
jgi:protein-S-isoprenylcysteine O-methyltransferase Ste14